MTKEEAIKIVKDLYDKSLFLKKDKEAVRTLIPEVEESEDEKVCKEIKQFIRSRGMQLAQSKVESWIVWLEKQGEQKPAWSEEDDAMIDNVLGTYKTLEDMLDLTTSQDKDILESMNFERDWLKFLKDRVQPKQRWSEEDERKIEDIRDAITLDDELEESYKEKLHDFLKSLCSQNTWKPSDAQIASITCAVRKMKESACYDSELVSLFNDLKKLREEQTMKLIDKDALVVEIEKLINEIYAGRPFDSLSSEQQTSLWYVKSIMSSINTLEVKEVDLDKKIDLVEDKYHGFESLSRADIVDIAKHFYELGLKTQKGE